MSNDSKWEPEKAENNTNLEGKVLQPWKKYLEQSKEVKQSWTGAENFDKTFLRKKSDPGINKKLPTDKRLTRNF